MSKKTRRVWGIVSAIRRNSTSPWGEWGGIHGVYGVDYGIPDEVKDIISHRPFCFRTRKQAREYAKRRAAGNNKTWTWVKYKVVPVEMSWKIIRE